MIVADTSVWIGHLRNDTTRAVARFRELLGREPILLGDIILLEILQGARTDRDAAEIERPLRAFPIARMLDDALASVCARNYRALRSLGISVRKTADLIIGTYCIERGHLLLHNDRDFEPMQLHLGLRVMT